VSFALVNSDHGALIVNRLDQNNDCYGVGFQILKNGSYEPEEVEELKSLLTQRRTTHGDGVVALDGGANIGVHSLEWARLMRGWGSVIAVEAQERIFYCLAGNLALQNCGNARAIWAALSDNQGTLSFPEPDYSQPGSFGSLELKHRPSVEYIGQVLDYDTPDLTVRTLAIDELNLPRLDLLKLDIEGMELEALHGAKATIQRCRPIICVEWIKSDKHAITALLDGYKVSECGMNLIAMP
jgi:FkbM family methyltransferase